MPETKDDSAPVSVEDLAKYVAAPRSADRAFLDECLTAAVALIAEKVNAEKVPPALLNSATKQVAGNLYQRRQSSLERAGLGDGADMQLAFHRPALDPLTPAWPLLATWRKGTGIA